MDLKPTARGYCDMVLEDSMEAPRDLKQVQNFKHSNVKQQRPATNRKNTADDIQVLINTMNDNCISSRDCSDKR
jgi:hypothetical protein